MLTALRKELHYQYRCLRLTRNLLLKKMLHCNLQVTYRCNFQCRICDFWKIPYSPDDELSLDDIRRIGRQLNRLGTLIVSLAGGEPLMREDLFDVITVLNQENHFPILITNGWFVDEALAKDILRAGLQEISVSVDYADPARHDALASLAQTYLAYCDCTRKGASDKMLIAAAFTGGDSDNLRVGRNGVFYDRQGRDWDATITKIIENPISIRQAFWAPYKKVVRMIEEQVAKRAAEADAAATQTLGQSATAVVTADPNKPAPPPPPAGWLEMSRTVLPEPAQPPDPAKEQSLMLTEGQSEAGIQVEQIDEKGGWVKVNNFGTEMVVAFERDGFRPPNPASPAVSPAPLRVSVRVPAAGNR
jgi:uncharacterized Fe-S cluster-containing radical SAM superfamily protein